MAEKLIEMDLCGLMLSQGLLDRVVAQAANATGGVTIILRHVGTPRRRHSATDR